MKTVFDLQNSFEYAMHGNGAYRGLRQTNTLDAMLYWYQRGVRVFEIDMARTSDDQYVAVAHYLNKKDLRRLEIFELPAQCTADWFMKRKLFSVSTRGLKPLSLQMIVDLLCSHQDMIVMLDLFGMFTLDEAEHFVKSLRDIISDREDLWKRILIETYNSEMMDGIQKVSDNVNIISCVRYEENEKDEHTVKPQELLSRGVHFVSYPWYCSESHPGEVEDFAGNGLIVFSRTKDNTMSDKLKQAGVKVNIVAQKYDGWRIVYQYPMYMLTYLKRIGVKIYIKLVKSK